MTDIAIQVENLSKMYRIGGQQFRYKRFTETMMDTLTAPIRRLRNLGQPIPPAETLWALKDVSFEVKEGEVVGIIGRNGAGKSTLLKILSRITEPTEGEVRVYGRVGSLLEVGTGFHPELTGRENIFLNGTILGMKKPEIERKFDEIVAFAEIEKFLDTPVKRYSSGMYVRLAFAVAAYLEPEILVVDEVLAVGDAQFQKKCLGKMSEVAKSGRTVLFVSHNMGAVKTLCSSAILMKNGQASPKQAVEEAILAYSSVNANQNAAFPIRKDEVILHSFEVTQDGYTVTEYSGDKPIDISIQYELTEDVNLFRVGFFITTLAGDLILRSLLADWQPDYEVMGKGRYEARCQIPPKFLTAANYILEVHCSRYGVKDYGFNSLTQQQIAVAIGSDFNRAHLGERTFGFVLIDPKWWLEKIH
jgi:lipopolysaccharide transport system ATP-binding protein